MHRSDVFAKGLGSLRWHTRRSRSLVNNAGEGGCLSEIAQELSHEARSSHVTFLVSMQNVSILSRCLGSYAVLSTLAVVASHQPLHPNLAAST